PTMSPSATPTPTAGATARPIATRWRPRSTSTSTTPAGASAPASTPRCSRPCANAASTSPSGASRSRTPPASRSTRSSASGSPPSSTRSGSSSAIGSTSATGSSCSDPAAMPLASARATGVRHSPSPLALDPVAQHCEEVPADDLVVLDVVGVEVGLEVARAEAGLLERRAVHDLGRRVDAIAGPQQLVVLLGRALRDRLARAGRTRDRARPPLDRRPRLARGPVAVGRPRIDALMPRALHRPGDQAHRRGHHAPVPALARIVAVDVEGIRVLDHVAPVQDLDLGGRVA